jgi:membrane-associated phospholipid phosphatase
MHDLWTRARHLFPLKLLGTSAGIGLFFAGYFYLQEHPAHVVTVMPLTPIDRLIPFAPAALWVYLSLWVYIGAGPGLQRNLAELRVYWLWMIALCLAGLAIFYFWPTAIPQRPVDVSASPMFAMLKRVDAAGNAFPSMHVAGAIFTAIRVHDVLARAAAPYSLRVANGVWFVLIVWSTLATKQHVFLDVAGGAALGLVFALASLRWRAATS